MAFSKAYIDKTINLEPHQTLEEFIKNIIKLPGIGLWTANYIALKGLKHPDAFPETDLFIARAIKLYPKNTFDLMKPMRGYISILLWREYAAVLSKVKTKKTK